MDYSARVQILCAKLSGFAQCQQLDTIIRCLDSLNFKLQTNLFPAPVEDSLIKLILKTVGQCLSVYFPGEITESGPYEHAKYLELIISIIEQSMALSRDTILVESNILESIDGIFEDIVASLQRIRSRLLSTVPTNEKKNENAFFILSETIPYKIEQTINRICSICPPSNEARLQSVANPSKVLPTVHHPNPSPTPPATESCSPVAKKRGGAGAIIYSDLVQQGWKLPAVMLVDKDDRFLFALETKMKLSHGTVRQDLDDAMVDFPAAVLLRRPVLLAAVLDVLGGSALQEETYYGGELTSLYCLHWMSELLQKAQRENLTQAEGSLCSNYGCEKVRATSLASEELFPAEMAHAMQSQRYPNLAIDEEEGTESMKELHSPSLSGLAFACVAASLPLLQGQVNSTASEVLRLAGVALPLLLEPAARTGRGPSTEVNYRRVQHLLNRMEQLLNFFDSLGTYFIPAEMTPFEYIADAEADADRLSTGSFQMTFLCLFLRVMHLANLLTFSHDDETSPQPHATCYLELLGPGTVPLRPPRGDNVRPALLLLGQRCYDCAVTILVQQNSFSVFCCSPLVDLTVDLLKSILLKAKGPTSVSQVVSARSLARSVLNLLSNCSCDTADETTQLLEDCGTVLPLFSCHTMPPALPVGTRTHADSLHLDINGLFNSLFAFLVHSLNGANGGRQRAAAVLYSLLLRCVSAKDMEASATSLVSYVIDALDRCLTDSVAFFSTIATSFQFDKSWNSTTPLLTVLADPCFLHCMVMKSCNSAKTSQFSSCVRVTNTLCDFSLRSLRARHQSELDYDHSAWKAWHNILSPLQILLWICEDQEDMEDSSRHGMRCFVDDLVKVFETSSESLFITSCRRSQLLGLFHRRQQVRVHAALNLYRVFGLPISLIKQADINIFDPFFGDNEVDSDPPRSRQLVGDAKKEVVGFAATKTITELLNLGKMCFGNLDISIRLIAFQQLSSAFSLASNSSLRALQIDWYLQLAQDCMGTLVSFLRRLDDVELVSGVTDSDCTIAKAAASLLHGLGRRSVELRRAFGFDITVSKTTSSHPDLHVKSLLSILFHFSRASGQVGSPFYTTLQYLAKNSLQLLSYLVCHSGDWTAHFPDQNVHVAMSNSVNGFDSLSYPSFLPFILRLPSWEANEIQLAQPDLPHQHWEAAALEVWDLSTMEQVVAPRDLVELAIRDLHCRPKEQIYSVLSQRAIDLLTRARSHRELKRAVDLTDGLLLSLQIDDFLSGLIVHELNPFRALANIVTTLPKTRKDYTSLILSLRLLDNVYKFDKSGSNFSRWDINFISEALEGVIEGFGQYFRSNSFSASQEKDHHPDLSDGDYQRVNAICQQSFLKLLGTLISHFHREDYDGSAAVAINAILPPGAVTFSLIVHVAIAESYPISVRKTAFNALEAAVMVIGPQVIAETDTMQSEPFINKISTVGTAQGLIRAAKSLRHTDTFQGNCLLIASLKAILIYVRYMPPLSCSSPEMSGSKDEDEDICQLYDSQWGWIRMFLYHRHAAVKLIAAHIVLSLVSKVVKYRHFERPKDGQPVWPPYEQLSHLVGDTFECKAVRAIALRALAHCVHHYVSYSTSPRSPSREIISEYEGPVALGPILQCVVDLLTWSFPSHYLHSSCDAISNALLSLRLLLTSSTGQVYTNNLLLMRSMKIFALVTETFRTDFTQHMLKAVYSRIHFQYNSKDGSAIDSGWVDFNQIGKEIYTQSNMVRLYAGQVMLSILRVDQTMQSDLFLQSITYTSILPSIISYQWLSEHETNMSNNILSIDQLRLRLCSVAGLFDILSESLVIILSDPEESSSMRVKSKLKTLQGWSQKVMNTISHFTTACLHLPLNGEVEVDLEMGILSSVLRLISYMVGDYDWWPQRAGDGLDRDDCTGTGILFEQMLPLRHRLAGYSVYTRVGQQLDTVLALLIQQNRGAGLRAASDDSGNILTRCISDVVLCSQLLAPSAVASSSSSSKFMKSKNDKIADDKWRKKARSYQVNRATPAASQPNLMGDDVLSMKDKQRIMAALVFLTCAFPSAPEMVELAIESDLHNALNILLRYARRYAVKSSSAAAVAADCVSGQEWRPSSGQVAAAVLAALSAFLVAPSGKSRQVFSQAGIPTMSLIGRDDVTASSALHQLWIAGLGCTSALATATVMDSQNRGGIHSAGRWLSLRLLSGLLADGGSGQVCAHIVPPLVQQMKNVKLSGRRIWTSKEGQQTLLDLSSWLHVLSTMLLSTRSGLHAYTQLQETMQPVLDILLTCLTISPDSYVNEDGGEAGDFSNKWDPSSWRMLRAAALRCVCALCQVDRLSAEQVDGRVMNRLSATTSVLNSGLCEVVVQVLNDSKGLEASDGCVATESSLAVVGLWCLVHQSERAKAMVRRQSVSTPRSLSNLLLSSVEEEDAEDEEEESGEAEVYLDPRILRRARRRTRSLLRS